MNQLQRYLRAHVPESSRLPARVPARVVERDPSAPCPIGVTGKIVIVRRNKYGQINGFWESYNIVTDDGDLYYAERGALLTTGTPIAPVPTDFTDTNGVPDMIMELYNGASAAPAKGNDRSNMTGLVTGSDQVIDATYPLVNDGDSDNTGALVDAITYRVSYATGDANATGIDDVILTNPTPGGTENLISHADGLGAFEKTASDTLKVFVNHQMNGT